MDYVSSSSTVMQTHATICQHRRGLAVFTSLTNQKTLTHFIFKPGRNEIVNAITITKRLWGVRNHPDQVVTVVNPDLRRLGSSAFHHIAQFELRGLC